MDEEDHINIRSHWVQILLQWILCDISNIRYNKALHAKVWKWALLVFRAIFFQVGRFGKNSHLIGSCTASLQEPIECEFLP